MSGTDLWTLGVIVGMACVTLVTRCFFFMSSEPWHLPSWAQRGLQFAPIAALAAVVIPELVMARGQLITSLQDARIYAALLGAAYFFWRRGQGQAVLGTIIVGMLVYLPLHLGLGW
jgi:branched-subunit amino acid transport protein